MLLFLVEKNEAALYNREEKQQGRDTEEHYEIHDNG